MREFINRLVNKENLSIEESRYVFDSIIKGEVSIAQMASLLTALRMKGETIEEITGAAIAMREHGQEVDVKGRKVIDVCGTGGDNLNTFNISTTTAFVVAATGVSVAKHGNRAVSSKSGSADLLESLGVNLDMNPAQVVKAIEQIGIGFLFAPKFHRGMRFATEVRKNLAFRTIFNILGAMSNPAKAKIQLLGVYDEELTETIACVLKNLGAKLAFVVHGKDGLDEVSTTTITKISHLKKGEVKTHYLNPEELGLKRATIQELRGGDVKENAKITLDILKGKKSPKRDIVILNSATALLLAEKVETLIEGISLAGKVIDQGLALEKLNQLIKFSKQVPREVM